jgi:very-short-patch-repair endonuclease
VLCDAARYPAAEDPMEWDIFRSGVLEAQGWQLHRLWSPHVFRDPAGALAALAQLVPGEGKGRDKTGR